MSVFKLQSTYLVACRQKLLFLVVVSVCLVAAGGVHADDAPMPDKKLAHALIYETLIAVNNANQTGNYTVLHGLGAPGFRQKFSIQDLAATFAALRQRQINLRPVVLLQPKISQSQFLPSKKIWRLRGHMATQPAQLNFELQYQYVRANWRLHALTIKFDASESITKNDALTFKLPI